MKRIMIIVGIIGWLLLPILCHVAYRDVKSYMSAKYIALDKACSSLDQATRSQVWGESKGIACVAEKWRSRYFIPFAVTWLLLGVGLGANLKMGKSREAANHVLNRTVDPGGSTSG